MDALFASHWTWLAIGVLAVMAIFGLVQWLGGSRRYERPDPNRDFLVESLLTLVAGDEERCERLLAQAIEQGRSEPRVFLAYGALLTRRGEAGRAARLFEGLLARGGLEPSIARYTHEALVEALVRGGRSEQALSWAARLAEPAHLDADRLERRARLALAARAYEVAESLALRLERLRREQGRRLVALCYAAEAEDKVDRGQRDEAVRLVRKALARDREAAAVWALDGQLLLEDGKLDKARASFLEALKLEAGLGIAVFPELEDAHIEAGQVADFEAMIHALLEARPHDPVALWALGSHLVRRRHLREGMTALGEAVETAPGFALARRELDRARAELEGRPEPIDDEPVDSTTRCSACGTSGVRGIVRCPVCAHVGTIVFLGVPAAPSVVMLPSQPPAEAATP
ncbi:MAG: hypothetical protein JXR83_04265 [Deltaproteobacteria bacterium]|nr:hypothetical protein [Deltaproteobacteria bacterium]